MDWVCIRLRSRLRDSFDATGRLRPDNLALFWVCPPDFWAKIGFVLGLYWLCFLVKSLFLGENPGKIGFVLHKKG
jgi:hypothetical protein